MITFVVVIREGKSGHCITEISGDGPTATKAEAVVGMELREVLHAFAEGKLKKIGPSGVIISKEGK